MAELRESIAREKEGLESQITIKLEELSALQNQATNQQRTISTTVSDLERQIEVLRARVAQESQSKLRVWCTATHG